MQRSGRRGHHSPAIPPLSSRFPRSIPLNQHLKRINLTPHPQFRFMWVSYPPHLTRRVGRAVIGGDVAVMNASEGQPGRWWTEGKDVGGRDVMRVHGPECGMMRGVKAYLASDTSPSIALEFLSELLAILLGSTESCSCDISSDISPTIRAHHTHRTKRHPSLREVMNVLFVLLGSNLSVRSRN